jgi:hypothetical protein
VLQRAGRAAHVADAISTLNQFGTDENFNLFGVRELCVPSRMDPPG